jgi:hypothetical protein
MEVGTKLISWIREHRLPGYPRIPICTLAALARDPTTEPQFICAVAAALAKAWSTPSTHAAVSPKVFIPHCSTYYVTIWRAIVALPCAVIENACSIFVLTSPSVLACVSRFSCR